MESIFAAVFLLVLPAPDNRAAIFRKLRRHTLRLRVLDRSIPVLEMHRQRIAFDRPARSRRAAGGQPTLALGCLATVFAEIRCQIENAAFSPLLLFHPPCHSLLFL